MSHLPLAVFLMFSFAFLGYGDSLPLEKLWSCKLQCTLRFIIPFRLSIKHQKHRLHENRVNQENHITDTKITGQEPMMSKSPIKELLWGFTWSLLQVTLSIPSIRQTSTDSVAQRLQHLSKRVISRINSYLTITFAEMQLARGWVEAVIATANRT